MNFKLGHKDKIVNQKTTGIIRRRGAFNQYKNKEKRRKKKKGTKRDNK